MSDALNARGSKTKFLAFLLFLSFSEITAAEIYNKYQDAATELWGVKDTKNMVIMPAQFEQIFSDNNRSLFHEQSLEGSWLIPVVKFGNYYRVDITGKTKFSSVYYENGHDYYQEGFARFIGDNGKVGFHNQKAEIVIEPIYDFAWPFKDGYSYVCSDCFGSYLGEVTFKPLSSSATPKPMEDLYREVIGGKWGAIDKNGKIVVPLNFSSWHEVDKFLNQQANN